MTIKPTRKIFSLTHRNCWGKPNIWIPPPLLQKNKNGRSQLYRDQIFSLTIYLYNRKFDWCLIVDPIWLVWHTYISHWSTHWSTHCSTHWSTHWTAHNIPDAPTKRYFFYKKITQWFWRILRSDSRTFQLLPQLAFMTILFSTVSVLSQYLKRKLCFFTLAFFGFHLTVVCVCLRQSKKIFCTGWSFSQVGKTFCSAEWIFYVSTCKA